MLGLVLEGGGARGSYQAGALRALHENGIEFDLIVGTSIGAINGALVAQEEYDALYDIWYNISPEKIFKLRQDEALKIFNNKFDYEDVVFGLKKIREIINNKGMDVSLAKEILRDHIDEKKIRANNKEFGLVTIFLDYLKPVEIFLKDIPEGRLQEYILASASLPYLKLDSDDGKKYLDGGFYDVFPIKMLLDRGCKEIWTIRLNAIGRKRRVDIPEDVLVHEICPKDELGGYLDFSNSLSRWQLELGYFDALRQIKGLKGKYYYVEGISDEAFIGRYLNGVSEEKIKELANLFRIKKGNLRRSFYEKIIPRVAELLGLDASADYLEILVELLEIKAREIHLPRFKLYGFEAFWEIMRNAPLKEEEALIRVPDFVIRNEILTKIVKKNLCIQILNIILKDNNKVKGE